MDQPGDRRRSADVADQDAFERKILTIRKQALNTVTALAEQHGLPELRQLYMPSFSTRTLVYKGLLLAPQVGSFYEDLRNPLTVSALASSISAFRPTLSPPGGSPTRTASSATTARSTRCAATSIGWRRGGRR